MTTNDHSTRTHLSLDTVYEMNEANAAGGGSSGIDPTDVNQTKSNTDSLSKLNRLQAVFSKNNSNDKKTTTTNSHTTNNTSGPGGGGSNTERIDGYEEGHNVTTLSQYSPVPSGGSLSGKSQASNSSSSSAKQFLTKRVRSRSKTDAQSVSDKSLFSRLFSKKSKKPTGSLISTTTKSIDLDINKKRANKTSLTTNDPRSTIDEEEEYNYGGDDDNDDRNISAASLSDTDQLDDDDNVINTSRSSNATRGGTRKNSGNGKNTNTPSNTLAVSTSDAQYYASLSSAPTGYSISYHKHITKGSDDLRIQAALGRLQQQSKKGNTASGGGTSQLMSLFQDPQRSVTQSPTPMSGTTRVKTFSGQTIITRNSSSSDRPSTTYCIRSSSISPTHDADETFISDDEIYTHFMKCHTCYDIMPKSSKLVVFDTQLAVKKAFFALVYNGVRAAPLWDTKRQKFIGLLTITDFILILQKYYKEPHAKIEELEEHRIETWREVLREYERPLLHIRPAQDLFEAVRILLDNHVHRLPIVDPITNNVIFILTHKRILRFFYLYFYDWPQPSFMSKTLEELNLGTYENLIIIEETTTVIEALGHFVKHRVSALPVIDKNKKLVNIYSKFDVIGLAADKSYRNLNMTIDEALSYRKERFEAVAKCYKHEILSTCIERIVKAEVHRLVIIDNDEKVIGVLSLSDVLYYIVIRPNKIEQPESKPTTNEEIE